MTSKITPDKARELLNLAHQGATFEQRPVTVAAKYAPLAEAAYALAQTVAGMHYEYAAQVEKNGRKYIITDSDEGHWLCGDDHKVLQDWHKDRMDAEDYAHSWNKHEGKRDGTTAHVIHRLVGDVEVVE